MVNTAAPSKFYGPMKLCIMSYVRLIITSLCCICYYEKCHSNL